MKKRPFALFLYSLIMGLSAISFPLQICWNYEIPIYAVSDWWRLLTLVNVATLFGMLAASVLAYRGMKATFYVAPMVFTMVAFNNWWVGYVGTEYSLIQTSFATFGSLLITSLLIEKKARTVLLNRSKQWWRMANRVRVHVPITLHPWVGETINATTFDISETGIFVSVPLAQGLGQSGLDVGDHMQMRLNLVGYKGIRCTGRLIRLAEKKGAYPEGLGIAFEDISAQDKQHLRRMLEAQV